jgi:hypothetical protein
MAAFVAAAFIVLGFAIALSRLGLVEIAEDIGRMSRKSLTLLRDPSMDDRDKEKAMQASARSLFGAFLKLTAGLVVALAVPTLIVWGVAQTGLFAFKAVIETSLTWPFLLGGFVVFAAVLVRGKRR